MDLLKLPTDNLYKFLAVSGLVAFLGCGYLAFAQRQNLDKQWAEHNSRMSFAQSTLDNLT